MKSLVRVAKKNLETSLIGRHFPKCFETSEQYEEWLEQESVAHTKLFRKDICEDCNSCFKSQMVLEGRCVNPQRIIE